MRWEDERQSSNIEDRRHQSSRRAGFSGGSIGALIPVARFLLRSNVGRIVLVVGAIAYFMGFNPLALLDGGGQKVSVANEQKDNQTAAFVSTVLATTEDVWTKIFSERGARYAKPTMVLFRGATQSGCGFASKQTGPFYCPRDHKVYLDLSFFDELQRRHDAPGDFAQAYVIAHEIGHHVQNLAGTLDKVHARQQVSGKSAANKLQVKVELQADCYAGVWAHYIDKDKGLLEQGDIKEALNAANAIGDDTLQKQSQGFVVPDSFTHGSSQQRMEWFQRGFQNGTLQACDTGA